EPPPVPVEDVEAQARGPVHEGFAQPPAPGTGITVPNPIVPHRPPDPITELAPEEEPEGAVWLSGYWSWDDDRQDFVGVSGFDGIPPAGRKWVPGYWTHVKDGWRWVSGYWASASSSPRYFNNPPNSIDTGPSVPAPEDDNLYVPGTWVP